MGWLDHNHQELDVNIAEHLGGSASGSLFSRIVGGIITPLAIGGYGLYACITQTAIFRGKGGLSLELTGLTAVSFGIALLGLALFLHFHFIWTVSQRLFGLSDFLKIISMLIFLGGLGRVLWQIVMVGV